MGMGGWLVDGRGRLEPDRNLLQTSAMNFAGGSGMSTPTKGSAGELGSTGAEGGKLVGGSLANR